MITRITGGGLYETQGGNVKVRVGIKAIDVPVSVGRKKSLDTACDDFYTKVKDLFEGKTTSGTPSTRKSGASQTRKTKEVKDE